MDTPQIVFLDTVHPVLQQRLEEAGFLCTLLLHQTREEVLTHLQNATGLVLRSRLAVNRELLQSAPHLSFIARSGSGLENIDLDFAHQRGIVVFNSPEGNRDAVAEHTIGMLLMLLNNLKRADIEVRLGQWNREKNRGHELAGKTVAIIGFGMMGSALAEKLRGFNCAVIAHDKYKKGFSNVLVSEVSLEQVYASADVVSLHLPLSAETRHYANDDFFNSFRKPVYFINTSRGAHVDTAALIRALDNGRVPGACLDVLEFERPSLDALESVPETLKELWKRENVILTPHIAGWTVESYEKLSSVLADKILAWWQTKQSK